MTILDPSDLEVVRRISVFTALKPEVLQALVDEGTVLNLRPGNALFRQGEPATSLIIIVEGWIKLYRVTTAGNEVVLGVLTRGESLAEAVSLSAKGYSTSACAVTRSRVVVIPADHVIRSIRNMPDIAIAVISSTSAHLNRMAQRIEQLTARSAIQRVADFLTSLCPSTEGPCRISLPYDKSLIAQRLGLKPESLSRVFAKLRSLGVDVRASEVVVNEVAVLRTLATDRRVRNRTTSNPKHRKN